MPTLLILEAISPEKWFCGRKDNCKEVQLAGRKTVAISHT